MDISLESLLIRPLFMIELSLAEENYLKAIFHLAQQTDKVSTRAIAQHMDTKDSSVTNMLRKLSEKKLIDYEKRYGVSMTESGNKAALTIIRRHRLWEVFLVDKLGFKWDEVHELAEQLEHIQSPKLLEKLDLYLGSPTVDPHGDPIPDASGQMIIRKHQPLSEAELHVPLRLVRVRDDSSEFLQYLDLKGLQIGTHLQVVERISYDESLTLQVVQKGNIHISEKVAQNLLVSLI